jgi:protease II
VLRDPWVLDAEPGERVTSAGAHTASIEPAKWIARLRRLRTDDNMIAFRINLDAGHAGAAGRFDRLREVALAYAFAIKVAGAAL